MQYTLRERTVKNKTIDEAVKTAKQLLKEKHQILEICIDAISQRSIDEKITVEELNGLVNTLVDDTLYHSGHWLGTNSNQRSLK